MKLIYINCVKLSIINSIEMPRNKKKKMEEFTEDNKILQGES